MPTRKVVEFLEPDGSSPYAKWFARLDAVAAAKVATALYRMEQGNLSNVKPVGQGVAEYRIDFGPGYRIYIGQDGDVLIILLGGGTKRARTLTSNRPNNVGAHTKRARRGRHHAHHTQVS